MKKRSNQEGQNIYVQVLQMSVAMLCWLNTEGSKGEEMIIINSPRATKVNSVVVWKKFWKDNQLLRMLSRAVCCAGLAYHIKASCKKNVLVFSI